jgi:multiple sugar transport system ATP-binding protein
MKEGKVQQLGTPLEIYSRPDNLFVAQFVGTPPKNLLAATVGARGATLDTARFALPVPAALRPAVSGREGARVVIGIRPEDLSADSQPAGPGGAAVSAQVEVVEPLGDEVVVHARAGEELLIAKLPPDRVPDEGERIDFAVDLDRLHLFDAETEKRLAA